MHLSAGLVSALLVAAGCAEGSQLFVPVARNVLMRSPVQKIGVGTVRPLSSMTGTGTRRFSRMAHETAGERDQNDSCAPTNAASGIVGECWHRIDESPRSSKLQNKRRFVSLLETVIRRFEDDETQVAEDLEKPSAILQTHSPYFGRVRVALDPVFWLLQVAYSSTRGLLRVLVALAKTVALSTRTVTELLTKVYSVLARGMRVVLPHLPNNLRCVQVHRVCIFLDVTKTPSQKT
jgi:hypothetical protein